MKLESLRPLSWIYDQLSQVRVWAYQHKIFSQVELPVPVLSVGNLSVGGTGKTPVIDLILTDFINRGHKVGVVSRSYKAKAKSPVRVKFQENHAAEMYGDEPVWLAKKHQQSPIYVGPSKSENAITLSQNEKVDLLLVDDGFQHLRLHRQFNIVLLDISQPWSSYQVVPVGRLRESIPALSRADFILFTKSQFKKSETWNQLQAHKTWSCPEAMLSQVLGDLKPLSDSQKSLSVTLGDRCLGVCGLADPKSFHKLLEQNFPQTQFSYMNFADHAQFLEADITEIEKKCAEFQINDVVITEKDQVKLKLLQSKMKSNINWWVAPLILKFESGEKEFYEYLHKILP